MCWLSPGLVPHGLAKGEPSRPGDFPGFVPELVLKGATRLQSGDEPLTPFTKTCIQSIGLRLSRLSSFALFSVASAVEPLLRLGLRANGSPYSSNYPGRHYSGVV